MSLQACGSGASNIPTGDRKSTRLNSSHLVISYAVFCLKKKTQIDAPELQKEVEQSAAALAQAEAQVAQMTARVATAVAEHQAAVSTVAQSNAALNRAPA